MEFEEARKKGWMAHRPNPTQTEWHSGFDDGWLAAQAKAAGELREERRLRLQEVRDNEQEWQRVAKQRDEAWQEAQRARDKFNGLEARLAEAESALAAKEAEMVRMRKRVESMQRYHPQIVTEYSTRDVAKMVERPDGCWVLLGDVLALLPAAKGTEQ